MERPRLKKHREGRTLVSKSLRKKHERESCAGAGGRVSLDSKQDKSPLETRGKVVRMEGQREMEQSSDT